MNNSIGTHRRQSRLSLCQVFASLLSNERLSHRAGLTERKRLSCQSAAVTLCAVLGASLPPRELFVALLSAAADRGSIVSGGFVYTRWRILLRNILASLY